MSRSQIDRRAVLAGAAAIPAAAMPALALAATSPDAELLRLGNALDVATAAYADAASKLEPIMERVREEVAHVSPHDLDRHSETFREVLRRHLLPGLETSWCAAGLAVDSVAKAIFGIQPQTLAGLAVVAN